MTKHTHLHLDEQEIKHTSFSYEGRRAHLAEFEKIKKEYQKMDLATNSAIDDFIAENQKILVFAPEAEELAKNAEFIHEIELALPKMESELFFVQQVSTKINLAFARLSKPNVLLNKKPGV